MYRCDQSTLVYVIHVRAWHKTPTFPVTPGQLRGLALAEICPAHWVTLIVLHLGLEGCSQPRELWFVDINSRVCTCTIINNKITVCHVRFFYTYYTCVHLASYVNYHTTCMRPQPVKLVILTRWLTSAHTHTHTHTIVT